MFSAWLEKDNVWVQTKNAQILLDHDGNFIVCDGDKRRRATFARFAHARFGPSDLGSSDLLMFSPGGRLGFGSTAPLYFPILDNHSNRGST